MRSVLISLLVLAALPAAAQAGTAKFVVDLPAVNALGPRGITADATPPADEYLRDGKAYVVMPVAGAGRAVSFKGGIGFVRSKKRTQFDSLTFEGDSLTGTYRGRRYAIIRFSDVRRSKKSIATGSGVLTSEAASLLRGSFDDDVFRSGLRFFTSGLIPLS